MLLVVTTYMENSRPTYIIFGASGDLSKRYLLTALKNMNYAGNIVPISRKDYGNLKNLIQSVGEKIFHLAIPPAGVPEAIELIYNNFAKDNSENIKIILEKPFGNNLESAKKLVTHIDKYFSEEQIYRVDHYLAKQSLQKVVDEHWEKEGVASIQVVASEKIDVEGRGAFYEQTGALKDFVQSHLLEMAAITLSGSFHTPQREAALKNLNIVCDITKQECIKRGQYEGYRDEAGNPTSMTETFVSINLTSNDPAWHGVPITLSTGKALSEKRTQIIIKYKNGSEKIFNIEHEPGAYERVIASVIANKHDLFISSGEILQSWRILDAIEHTWASSTDDLIFYPKGIEINKI